MRCGGLRGVDVWMALGRACVDGIPHGDAKVLLRILDLFLNIPATLDRSLNIPATLTPATLALSLSTYLPPSICL